MSRITLALGSFIVGACCASLMLQGNHTSTLAQEPSPAIGIKIGGAEPVVPAVLVKFTLAHVSGFTQPLDGMDCTDCTFENVTLEYSGGAYRLTNFSFYGPVRVVLKGAAANTVNFLGLVQALEAGQQPKPAAPSTPIIRAAIVKQTVKGNTSSPFGVK